MADTPPFKYFAFISYSRRDSAFAVRLQKFLTAFHLPSRLCKQYPNKPRHLRPIYRDVTDLGVDNLNAGLEHGLRNSRYLIVICSPHSAAPNADGKNWINEEVRTFLSLAEENKTRVIPVLLRRKSGQAVKDCLPAAIQELELLAADVAVKGEKRVFSDVAAKMLALEPDELWNWWQRARRRRICVAAAAALTLCSAALWLAWDYTTAHYSYYADYVERNNIPHGIGRLTEEQTKSLQHHYRFTSYHYLLRKVENMNSAGFPCISADFYGHENRPVSIEIKYAEDENGNSRVSEHHYYDATGRVIQVRSFGKNNIKCHAAFGKSGDVDDMGVSGAHFELGLEDMPEAQESRLVNRNVQRMNVKRDAAGAVTVMHFCDATGAPVRNAEGVWGYLFERAPQDSRLLSITNLDAADAPVANSDGIVTTRYEYAEDDPVHISCVSYYGEDGIPVPGPEGAERVRCKWENGNWVAKTYCNAAGERCNSLTGRASWEAEYENGNPTCLRYFNAAGERTTSRYGDSMVRMEYDDQGRRTKESSFDTHDAPCAVNEGYSVMTRKYDDAGNIVEEAFYGTDRKPCALKGGVAKECRKFNEAGLMEEESYYDVNGKLFMTERNYAVVQKEYHKNGNCSRIRFLDIHRQPCLCKDNYAEEHIEYDRNNNPTKMSYFGLDGKPCGNSQGIAVISMKYEDDKLTEERYYDVNGALCRGEDGYAVCRGRYDARGRLEKESYYAEEEGREVPVLSTDGCAVKLWEYDDRGNRIRESYLGTDGTPCATSTGHYAFCTWKYNAGGLKTTGWRHVDVAYQESEGYAKLLCTYNLRGQIIEETFCNAAGEPCMVKGYATVKKSYNPDGDVVSEERFDTAGNRVDAETSVTETPNT